MTELRPALPESPVPPPVIEGPPTDGKLLRAEAPLPVLKPPQEPEPVVPVPIPPLREPVIDDTRKRRSERAPTSQALETRTSRHQVTRKTHPEGKASNARLAVILLFAAALGCAVGYLAYLQLPSPLIALTADNEPSGVVISWPSEQTRNAVYAAIRVDDGQQIPLTQEQKSAGQAKITPTGDNVKVELIAQHWMRDSRGIVRFVRPLPPPTAPTTPTTTAPATPQQ
jgi:hypothetical protein